MNKLTKKEKTATVLLPQGRLPVRLEDFQNVSGLGLLVAWSGPGFERRSLSATGQAAPLAREMPAAELVAQLLRETATMLASIVQ